MNKETIHSKTHRAIIENYFSYLSTHSGISRDTAFKKGQVKDILPYLKVSKGTFYRYYSGIQELNECTLEFYLLKFISHLKIFDEAIPTSTRLEALSVKLNLMKPDYHAMLVLYSDTEIEEKLFSIIKENNPKLLPYLDSILNLFDLIKIDEDCSQKDIVSILKGKETASKDFLEHFKGVIK